LGVKDGFGLMLFSFSKIDQAPLAAIVTARSAYFTAFDMLKFSWVLQESLVRLPDRP
jgi:hypothetical protein